MDPLLTIIICVFVGLCTFRLWFPPLVALLAVAVSIVTTAVGVVGLLLGGVGAAIFFLISWIADEISRRRRRRKLAKKSK